MGNKAIRKPMKLWLLPGKLARGRINGFRVVKLAAKLIHLSDEQTGV